MTYNKNTILKERKMKEISWRNPDGSWSHYCVPEQDIISNLQGDPCNWCDVKEPQDPPTYENTIFGVTHAG